MPINGVFGLTDLYLNKVENSTTKTVLEWPESGAGYGYFSQGISTPSAASAATNITRLEESTGTVSRRPTEFSVGKYERSALTSQYYAYFCCGANPAGSIITTIDRLDYSNETLSTSPEVAPPRISQAQSSSPQFGYVAGGTPGSVSTISRLTFSVDTFSTPGFSLLPAAREKVGVTKSYYGAHYIAGSAANSLYSRLDFDSEICDVRPAFFPQSVIGAAGISNRFFGYYVGGSAPPLAPIYQSSITRLDFATESFLTSPQVLSQRKNDIGSFSLSRFGYFGGGYFTPVAVHYSTIERFDFETEVDSAAGNLPIGVSRSTGIEGGYTKETFLSPFVSINPVDGLQFTTYRNKSGYFAGGGPEYISTVSKIEFLNETVSDVTTLPSGINSNDSIQSNSYSYIAGGLTQDDPSYVITSSIIRYEFVGDTVSVIPTKLPSARFELTGISGSLGYGYFAGGIVSPVPARPFDARSFISSIVRFEFANETTRSFSQRLPEVAAYQTGVSSGSYGYFVGGITETSFASTSVTRIDFTNDLLVTTIPSTLPIGRKNMGKLDSGLYGYFIGGENSSNALVTTISRIDFTTDTVSNSPATLGSEESQVGTVSAREYGFGYIAGGTPLNNGFERFSFTSETRSSVPATFSTNRNNMACFESVNN